MTSKKSSLSPQSGVLRVELRLPPDAHEILHAQAAAQDRTPSAVVTRLLRRGAHLSKD